MRFLVRHLSYGRGNRNKWRVNQERIKEYAKGLSPFTKGIVGGLAVGLLVLPLSNFIFIGGLCYTAYAFFKRRSMRNMDAFSPFASHISAFPKIPFPFNPVNFAGMHQFLKIMFPAFKDLGRVERLLREESTSRIISNSVLKERLGAIEHIEGPISQQLIQTNNVVKLRVQYQVIGSRNSGIVGIDAKLIDPFTGARNMKPRVEMKNMTLNVNGRVEKIPFGDDQHSEQIVIDAEVVDVKSEDHSGHHKKW
jgi:hypothetical protein